MDNDRKPLYAVLLLVFGVALFFGLPKLNWFRYELAVRDEMSDKQLGRFPDVNKILAFPATLKAAAAEKGFEDATVAVRLIEKRMTPVTFWFVEATITSGGQKFVHLRRVESKFAPEDHETLRAGGIEVVPVEEE